MFEENVKKIVISSEQSMKTLRAFYMKIVISHKNEQLFNLFLLILHGFLIFSMLQVNTRFQIDHLYQEKISNTVCPMFSYSYQVSLSAATNILQIDTEALFGSQTVYLVHVTLYDNCLCFYLSRSHLYTFFLDDVNVCLSMSVTSNS